MSWQDRVSFWMVSLAPTQVSVLPRAPARPASPAQVPPRTQAATRVIVLPHAFLAAQMLHVLMESMAFVALDNAIEAVRNVRHKCFCAV